MSAIFNFNNKFLKSLWMMRKSFNQNVRMISIKSNLNCPNIDSYMMHNLHPKSIDINELNKFKKLSTKWWNDDEFLPLRNFNQLRVPFVVDALKSQLNEQFSSDYNENDTFILKNFKLLDIGCGGGILSEALARLGANVYGIDPVNENILAAKNHAKISFKNSDYENIRLHYEQTTIEQFSSMDENKNAFDAVIASEVIEHVNDVKSFLHGSIDCIRPGGFLIITTINQTILSYIGIILSEYVFGFVPRGTHEYAKCIPPTSLSLILNQDFNCDVIKIHGMFFNPLTFQWSWTQDQSISYALLAQKRK